MGGLHGKHSDSEWTDVSDSSEDATCKDVAKEKPRSSAKYGDPTLLVEKTFSVGNKAVKEQIIQEKSSCTKDSSKKSVYKKKIISNVKKRTGTVSPRGNDGALDSTRTIVEESHGSTKCESVKSCSPEKESDVSGKEDRPQTACVKDLSKDINYLHYTIKHPKRVITRPVFGAIDLIKMTHRQFETKRDKNELCNGKDNQENFITQNELSPNSVVPKKEENIDNGDRKMSKLKDEARNVSVPQDKDAKSKNKELVNDEQVKNCTRNSTVCKTAPHGPTLNVSDMRVEETAKANQNQDRNLQEKLIKEKPTGARKMNIKEVARPKKVPCKKNEKCRPIGGKLEKVSGTYDVSAAHTKERKEISPHEMSLKSVKQIQNKTNVEKVIRNKGIDLKQVAAVNKQNPQEKLNVPCAKEVKQEQHGHQCIPTEIQNSKQLTEQGADKSNQMHFEPVITQNEGEAKFGDETEVRERIKEDKDCPFSDQTLERTVDSKSVAEKEKEEGKDKGKQKGKDEIVKEQTETRMNQTSKPETTGQVQAVTKTKQTVREKNVKGRRRKIQLKPPIDFVKKQGITQATAATFQKSSCDGTVGASLSKLSKDETRPLQKSDDIVNCRMDTTVETNESNKVNVNDETHGSKDKSKPEPSTAEQGKRTIKSPSNAHPPRSPAGDFNSRVVDNNVPKPGVSDDPETVGEAKQRLTSDETTENVGLDPAEDAVGVNFVNTNKPEKDHEKTMAIAVEQGTAKLEEPSADTNLHEKETKRERRKNRGKKDKFIEKLQCKPDTGIITEKVCSDQTAACPEQSKPLPPPKTGIPTEKVLDPNSNIKPKNKKVYVHEKEIRTENDEVVKRKLRIPVRKGPIPKGQPTLMDIVFCQSCGDTKQPNGQGLFHCPKCKSVFYCTRACQHNDAKRHKKTCTGVKRVYCKHV